MTQASASNPMRNGNATEGSRAHEALAAKMLISIDFGAPGRRHDASN